MVPRLGQICHVNLASGYSGGERQTELLIRQLADRDVRQRLVCRPGNDLATHCEDVPGLDVRAVGDSWLSAIRATRGCSVVHAHDGRAAYVALLARLLYGVPYVITRRVRTGKKLSGLRGAAYNRAARVVAISAAVEINLRNNGFEKRIDRIFSANAGFDVDDEAVRSIRAARPGKVLIGHAGTLDHSAKGQSTIIDVAHRVADVRPDWHFMLCGEGKDRTRFEAEIGDLGNVELVGWVDNIVDYLAAFDLFVFPSLKEALGSTLLDALCVGVPVVASNVGGIPEVIEDGVNGRLVEPENPEQLLAAIEQVLGDERELAAIRARNVEKSRLFSATHMADAYETLYREITAPM